MTVPSRSAPALPSRTRLRLLLVAMAGLLLAPVLAAPALAHGRASDATNYDSTVLAAPDAPGVRWEVLGGDEYLRVVNDSDAVVHVLGYEGEPYLRIGPDGVDRNALSPATYANADRYAGAVIPPEADASAAPRWERVGDGSSWFWHDHRTHWMSPTLPPAVRGDPGRRVVVQEWSVPVLVDGREASVDGELVWVPPAPAWPWLLAGLLLTAPALVGVWRGGSDPRRLGRPAAVVLGAVAALNLVHLADDVLATPLPLSTTLLAAVQTAAFIAVGIFGAVRGWQGRDGAFAALGVGSAAVFVGQGLLYLSSLTSSQVPSVAPPSVGRLAIALSLAQLVPVGAVAVIGSRRTAPPLPEQATAAASSASGSSAVTPSG